MESISFGFWLARVIPPLISTLQMSTKHKAIATESPDIDTSDKFRGDVDRTRVLWADR